MLLQCLWRPDHVLLLLPVMSLLHPASKDVKNVFQFLLFFAHKQYFFYICHYCTTLPDKLSAEDRSFQSCLHVYVHLLISPVVRYVISPPVQRSTCPMVQISSCPIVHLSSRPVVQLSSLSSRPVVQLSSLSSCPDWPLDCRTKWTAGQTGQSGRLDRLDNWTAGQTGRLDKLDDWTKWTAGQSGHLDRLDNQTGHIGKENNTMQYKLTTGHKGTKGEGTVHWTN